MPMWAGVLLLVMGVIVIPGVAIWLNMTDGRGNNAQSTRNRGISGERGDSYGDR